MMARKKERKIRAVYTVFEYEDKGPMEVILPDGRLATLIMAHDLYECTGASTSMGAVRRLRGRKIELLDDNCSNLEDLRETMALDGYDPEEIRKMSIELRPLVSFG
jgi:hypothetical protein